MFKKLDPKVNLSLTLAIIAGVSALLLALVNNLTAPVIADNQEKQALEMYGKLFPEMTSYEEVEKAEEPGILLVKNNDKVIGFICSASGSNGYGSVSALVGINTENAVVGVQFPKYNQTPGFGDKVKEPSYIEKEYVGDDINSIDATFASGATYSSKLVLGLVETCAADVVDGKYAPTTDEEAEVTDEETEEDSEE